MRIFLVLMVALAAGGCNPKPAGETTRNQPATSAVQAPSATPSPSTATSAATSATPPAESAWANARKVEHKELTARNCSARMLGPWLRLQCVTRANNSGVVSFEEMPGAHVQEAEASGDAEAKGPTTNTITLALAPRRPVTVKASRFYVPSAAELATAKKRNAAASSADPAPHFHFMSFTFQWPGADADPSVVVDLSAE